jgi:hypothetical protein
MKTKSFTLRIPVDLLKAIESKMGEANRSGFIIQTLRDALEEPQQIGADPRLFDQISEVLYQFETLKSEFERLSKRFEKLEESQKPLVSEPAAEYKTPGGTDSKTEQDTAPAQAEIAKTEEMAEIDLLELLNKEQPTKPWGNEKLRNYRRGNALKRRHTAGTYGFTYKEKDGKIHKWSVWKENLLPIDPEDSAQTTTPAGP